MEEKMKYRYFEERELRHNRVIPEGLVNNIIPTAKVLDELRSLYGKPIKINSSYRSPEYNASVKGAKTSLHLQYNALDFTVDNKADLPFLYKTLVEWDAIHKFDFLPQPGSMGLGLYNTFIHIDTRATLGRKAPARWKS